MAQDSLKAAIHQALLARVVGPGGCHALETIEAKENRFFPNVRFWQGTCSLEHGDIAQPVVATDAAGIVYLLDSEGSFNFLVRQHPPHGLDTSNVLEYVRGALIMQGKLPSLARLLRTRDDAPVVLCEKTGLVCDGLFLPRVEGGGRKVFLTAFTEWAIYSAGPIIVDLQSGAVDAVVEESYEGRRRSL